MANFTPQEIEEMLQEFFDTVGKRQYVGARYVPIFGRKDEDTITWNNLAPYEPLTVVMHNGVSYVSKQYVPAGIDITDTAFWAETYRFNAQVEQYRQEVLQFQSQIDQIREDYVPFPDSATYPKYGTLGQVLTTLTSGETKWEDPVTVDAAIAEPLIEAWLDSHPEATTTVQDGAITRAKLNAQLDDIIFTWNGLVNYLNYQTMLPSLSDAQDNSVVSLTMNEDNHQTDYPTAFGYGTVTMITMGQSTYKIQYIFTINASTKFALRRYFNNSWTAWTINDPSKLMAYANNVYTGNYSTTLPTLADAVPNSIYYITMTQQTHQVDYPTKVGWETMLLVTIGFGGSIEQYIFSLKMNKGMNAHRRYYNSAWSDWEYNYNTSLQFVTKLVDYNNYLTEMPTLADARNNSICIVTMSESIHQDDYPTKIGYASINIITYGNDTYKEQWAIGANLNKRHARRRYYNNSWHDWEYSLIPRRQIVIASSGGDFTNIVSGLKNAYDVGNTDVIVKAGTYNIVTAEQEIHGATYFQNVSFNDYGPKLGNNCTYYFESGAQVNCVLPSNASSAAQNTYSPFNAGNGDYEVIGLHVYSEFCRYCFHDELSGVGTYHHAYKDCYMHHNDTGNGYVQCIGGGLGAHGLIDIDGCVFESDTAESNSQGIVSWHNGNPSGIQSNINIRNCYFKNGHIRFSWYGTSTNISLMTICGCSFDTTIAEERGETAESTVKNTDVIAWNNEVRNP